MKSESEIMDAIRQLIYEEGPEVSKTEQAEMFAEIASNCEIEIVSVTVHFPYP